MRSEAEEFHRRFTIQAHYERGSGQLPKMLGNHTERGFRKNPLSNEYEDIFREAAIAVATSEALEGQPHPKFPPLAESPSDKGDLPAIVASVSTEAASSAPSDGSRDFTSEAQRIEALAAYTESGQCSEAALARTARVNPADLSKWKKGLLPVESVKEARIEKALKNHEAPTPPVKRRRNS